MRSDRPLLDRVADHQIVHAPTWYEVERVEQVRGVRQMFFDVLDQQCPVCGGQVQEGVDRDAVLSLGHVSSDPSSQRTVDERFGRRRGVLVERVAQRLAERGRAEALVFEHGLQLRQSRGELELHQRSTRTVGVVR